MANTLKFGNGNWATKDGSTLAYNDESGFNPLPFDFTRASSATVVNKNGLIEEVASGIPRIDFLGNTKGALLLEPQRTNVIPRSEDIDIGWSKLNVTVANNQTVSPDGTLNAALSTVTSTNGQHASYDTLSSFVTSGQPYYISCFVKKSNTRYIRLNEGYTGDQLYYDFDNNIATLGGGASDEIVEDFGNGWFRIGFKFVPTTVNSQFALYLNDNSNNNSYAGSGEDVYIYGAQLEAGSYATSYIPTSGSPVTRQEDVCGNGANSEVINSTEGVLYAEMAALADEGGVRAVSLNNGSTLNRISIRYNSTSNQIQYQYTVGGSVQASITYNVTDVTANHKIAVRWAVNDFKLFIDGVLRGTDVSGNVISSGTLTTLDINGSSVYDHMYAKIKDIRVFTTALTDAELQALTTI